MTEGVLVPFPASGRYAIDDPETGKDLMGGTVCEVYLGGAWIMGSVEYTSNIYYHPSERVQRGYYFIARKGGTCGLCVGMRVRVS